MKHEAEGGLLRRGLPLGDVFCVQAAIALSRFSLVGLGGRKAGEGYVCSRGSTLLLNGLGPLCCLSGTLRILFLI